MLRTCLGTCFQVSVRKLRWRVRRQSFTSAKHQRLGDAEFRDIDVGSSLLDCNHTALQDDPSEADEFQAAKARPRRNWVPRGYDQGNGSERPTFWGQLYWTHWTPGAI